MSGSRTTTGDSGRLDNVHPGEILREDFLVGKDISLEEVCTATGIAEEHLTELLDGIQAIDANSDLRLARYFGMTEGFFLGLQNDFDLEEERRAHGPEFDRIVRRAA